MRKRILAFLLAVCSAVSLLALPAAAVEGAKTFTDISDRNTAIAVESLRLMGVLDGYADGSFRPDSQLTRAQFCKMAVYALNGENQLGQYRTVTVFQDVKPSHWAAPYINMASKGKGIIAGYPNGKFMPGAIVTYGQAVTILMRMLGYKDEDMGGIWPDGYLASAANVGLTDGVTSTGYAPVTRGQAARLFLNLLNSDMKEGGSYAASVASSVVENVMLTTSTATGADGSDTAMQVGSGAVYTMANKTSTGALNGLKGTLLLDKAGKVLTFAPEISGSSRTVTVATATASKLTTASGESFAINGITAMYVNGEQKTWAEGYTWLNPGTSLTLYIGSSGSVEYIMAGAGSTAKAAVVAYSRGSTAGFSELANGNTRYGFYKNGAPATASDVRPYDVATYDPTTNSIRLCDTRITGIYENASPNLREPSKITVLGREFDVLPTAADTMSKLTLGKQITLLLTEDNQVAGAIEAGSVSGVNGNAAGIVREVSTTAVTVDLLCGISVSGTVQLSELQASRLKNRMAVVSSSQKGLLGVTQLTGGVPGDLDVAAKTMGGKRLAENVAIYQVTANGVEAIQISQIPAARVPASGAIYARTDWVGRVDLIVLSNITGSDYRFGRLSYTRGDPTYDDSGNVTKPGAERLSVVTGNGMQIGPFSMSHFTVVDDVEVHDGDYVGVILNKQQTLIETILVLSKYGNVSNSAWSSQASVTVGGRSYTVPSDVLCYNKTNRRWVTLDEARAFATSSTLYVDKSGYVRVVEVQ